MAWFVIGCWCERETELYLCYVAFIQGLGMKNIYIPSCLSFLNFVLHFIVIETILVLPRSLWMHCAFLQC